MGLLQKVAGGALTGFGDALIANGKSLRDQKRAQLKEQAATGRTQMLVNSREKTAGATLTEQTRGNKAKEALSQKMLAATVNNQNQTRAEKRATRKAASVAASAKVENDRYKLGVDTALKTALSKDPATGETVFNPKIYNEMTKAVGSGTPVPEPLPVAPVNPADREVGQWYTAPNGQKGKWTIKGWEVKAPQ